MYLLFTDSTPNYIKGKKLTQKGPPLPPSSALLSFLSLFSPHSLCISLVEYWSEKTTVAKTSFYYPKWQQPVKTHTVLTKTGLCWYKPDPAGL